MKNKKTFRYSGVKGVILKKWDWWAYSRAYKSLARICENEPAYGYLIELQIKEWNAQQNIPAKLKTATQAFHNSLQPNVKNNRSPKDAAQL